MLTIIRKWANVRRFMVWDLEWKPKTYELRMCGVYDANGGYRWYTSIRQFLEHELIPSNSGKWIYAHFGGMADLQFLIAEFVNLPAYNVRGAFSGASCVVCYVRHGRNVWTFVDSFWLLRSPLKDIAVSMGMQKTGPQDDMSEEARQIWYADVALPTLVDYNENDCIVLWTAIHRAQCEILELGGQLQMTLASTAMQLFRRKYLKDDIGTNHYVNEISRKSYFASRVEVFQKNVNYEGLYYDVNSSFPYAMTFPLPGRLRGNYRTIPIEAWDKGYPFIADCQISVPDCYLPPIPYRLKNKVFFPTGKWRNWFSGIDLELLLKQGGRIERVFDCKVFEPFMDLSEYAQDIYALRKAATDPFRREFLKLLMNALYGKFAEGSDKTTLVINPTARQLDKLSRSQDMLAPGIFFTHSEVPIPHAHVPVSSYITAIARRTLFDFIQTVSEVHYCDTDGFSTSSEDIISASQELGGLKLEKSFSRATFPVPKLYRWYPSDGKPPVVKAKGFSLGKDKTKASERFDHLMLGGEVIVERMMRLKEMMHYSIRHGTPFQPRDVVGKGGKPLTKRLRQSIELEMYVDRIGKRFMYPDGLTRPWTMEELENGIPQKGRKY